MDSTNSEIECKCPICNQPVTKVKELKQEDSKQDSKCCSEYYQHKGNKLYKITNPITPTDLDRKKYE